MFFGNKSQLAMIKTRTSVSGENNVISASLEFRSVANTPKHIIKVSASSWLLPRKGPNSLLLLVWPAAEINLCCSPMFSQPNTLSDQPLSVHVTEIDSF